MSRLVEFYRGQATDTEGRLLTEIWTWNDDRLEEVHDFIQWLFPLPEASRFNADAPLLTAEDRTAFHSEEVLRGNLRRSFDRFLTFLGLAWTTDGQIAPGDNLAERIPDVWAVPNHNWLRISRVLRSLCLLGLEAEAQALYEQLNDFFTRRRFPIRDDTFRYWTEAVRSTRTK